MLKLLDRSPTSTATLLMTCTKLTICILIIQSLNANMEGLNADHLNNSCKSLFLSETGLETSFPDLFFLPKFVKTRHLKDVKGLGLSVLSTKMNCEIEIHDSMIKVLSYDKVSQWMQCIDTTPVTFQYSWKTLKNTLLPRLPLSRAISTTLTQHAL